MDSAQPKTDITRPSIARPSIARVVGFRVAAVLLGLSPLLGCEGVLWLLDAGRPSESVDPFVAFDGTEPLFEQVGDRFVIPVSRQTYFRPESFESNKRTGQFRIFCLGGSTVQGRPYAIESSFTTWLELSLTAADPDRDWQVVNCGGVSYASYRLAPILNEVLRYQPDLVILYTGHNEFLEDRRYATRTDEPAGLNTVHRLLSQSRTYRLAYDAWHSAPQGDSGRALLPAEVDALLDYRGGLEQYHRDDDWRNGVVEHFEFNVRRMVARCRQAGVPILLVNPVANLNDCPPFKVESSLVQPTEQSEFQRLWNACQQEDVPLQQRIELLEQAVRLDPRHAGAWYFLGKCYEATGRAEQAARALTRAKDEDICPLRIVEPMREALRRIAEETSTPLVDVNAAFVARSEQGLPGEPWMIDHVHPTIKGHQLIAELLVEELQQQRFVVAQPDWQQRRKQLYRRNLETLDEVYYSRGKERLEGLRRWSQGRAFKVRQP